MHGTCALQVFREPVATLLRICAEMASPVLDRPLVSLGAVAIFHNVQREAVVQLHAGGT